MSWRLLKQKIGPAEYCGEWPFKGMGAILARPEIDGRRVRITVEVEEPEYAVTCMSWGAFVHPSGNTSRRYVEFLKGSHPDPQAGAEAEAARLNALEQGE